MLGPSQGVLGPCVLQLMETMGRVRAPMLLETAPLNPVIGPVSRVAQRTTAGVLLLHPATAVLASHHGIRSQSFARLSVLHAASPACGNLLLWVCAQLSRSSVAASYGQQGRSSSVTRAVQVLCSDSWECSRLEALRITDSPATSMPGCSTGDFRVGRLLCLHLHAVTCRPHGHSGSCLSALLTPMRKHGHAVAMDDDISLVVSQLRWWQTASPL